MGSPEAEAPGRKEREAGRERDQSETLNYVWPLYYLYLYSRCTPARSQRRNASMVLPPVIWPRMHSACRGEFSLVSLPLLRSPQPGSRGSALGPPLETKLAWNIARGTLPPAGQGVGTEAWAECSEEYGGVGELGWSVPTSSPSVQSPSNWQTYDLEACRGYSSALICSFHIAS